MMLFLERRLLGTRSEGLCPRGAVPLEALCPAILTGRPPGVTGISCEAPPASDTQGALSMTQSRLLLVGSRVQGRSAAIFCVPCCQTKDTGVVPELGMQGRLAAHQSKGPLR